MQGFRSMAISELHYVKNDVFSYHHIKLEQFIISLTTNLRQAIY